MRRYGLVLVVLISLIAPVAHGQTLGAVLTGAAEVPPNNNPGFGNATVTFDAARENVQVTITVANLGSPINNFHIHESAAGANGPVVLNLIGLGGAFVNGSLSGTFPVTAAVAQRMLQNPGNFYVNVHTTSLPGGAVRGQLSYVSGGTISYAAELRAGNEVPPAPSSAFGSAFITFDPVNNTIAWDARASGIVSPTVSHVHRGAAAANGPVVINFATSAAQIPGGRTRGAGPVATFQSANLTADDLTNLYNPNTASGFYVNIHSSAAPGGEVRGQLAPANEYDIPIAGRVTNSRGQTFVTDVRIFNPNYSSPVTALLEYFPASLGANANASASIAVNIQPRGTAVLDDVAGAAHFNMAGTTGAVRVSSASQLAVTSRVYVAPLGNEGTFGQFVPAQPRSAALRRGVMPHLSHSTDAGTGFRTNVGLFNPTQGDVTVRLELRDDAGALLGQKMLVIAAQSQQQQSLITLFPDAAIQGKNVAVSFDASSAIVVYATVNDNVSGDSILVPAQPDPGTAANQQ